MGERIKDSHKRSINDLAKGVADLRCRLNWAEKLLEEYKNITKGVPPERLQEICEAEKDGRLHLAPVQDGTVIWVINDDPDMFPEINVVFAGSYLYGYTEVIHGEMGKDWFLTENEALKARAGNDRY